MDVDEAIRTILRDFLSKDGRYVDYVRLKVRRLWNSYIQDGCLTVKDKRVVKGAEAQKKSYFINLYNVACIYAVCRESTLPQQVNKVQEFFDKDVCLLAGERFSLNDILHGVLRANSPHPSSKTPYFDANSSKCDFALKGLDPRVLFAVNSGDMTSPPLRIFTITGIEEELNAAVKDFCNLSVSWNPVGRVIVLPRLFLWFRKDFPGGHDVATVRWVTNFLNASEALSLRSLVDELELVGGVRIIHDNYDWRLNQM